MQCWLCSVLLLRHMNCNKIQVNMSKVVTCYKWNLMFENKILPLVALVSLGTCNLHVDLIHPRKAVIKGRWLQSSGFNIHWKHPSIITVLNLIFISYQNKLPKRLKSWWQFKYSITCQNGKGKSGWVVLQCFATNWENT